MNLEKAWDKEYKNPVLVTKHDEPQKDTLRFIKFLKKQGLRLNEAKMLDLGSGTGRNANYLSEQGSEVTGIEISGEAIRLAENRAKAKCLTPKYIKGSIGSKFPVGDESIDAVLDVFTSHLLTESERELYLSEMNRVLKPGAYIFIKTMAKEGDSNAQNMLKNFPGKEKDTYVLPELEVQERVFSGKDFRDIYSKYFEIVEFEKKSALIPFKGQSYKRKFILAYLRKPEV